VIVLIVVKLSIIYNKRKITTSKKIVDFSEQSIESDIVKNNINKEIVLELYQMIEKYFNIKMCYLRANDKIQYFYDMDSFKLGENCEEFEAELESKYNIKDIDLKDRLLDLMIKMQRQRDKMSRM
jgi:5'-deoxynucleotidase YfbR-like HD superfamily hydrolase